jgi:hypothetical protein
MRSKWLDWQPNQSGSVGFEGSHPRAFPIIPPAAGAESASGADSLTLIIEKTSGSVLTKPAKASVAGSTSGGGSVQVQSTELAPCGSPHCAGCYDVGDGRKIHPPRCGEAFLRWRAWMEGKGPIQ